VRDSSRSGEAHAGKKRAKFGSVPQGRLAYFLPASVPGVGALAWIGDGGLEVKPGPRQVQTLHLEKSR
jgi:hypothetical protein